MRTNVKQLRQKYPEGTELICIRMEDKQAVPEGTKGEVTHVDDIGTIHMKWQNGSTLGLIPERDIFKAA